MTLAANSFPGHLFRIAVVTIFYLLLFLFDHKTNGPGDLFHPSNIFALILYAVPTYLICLFAERLLFRSAGRLRILWSFFAGLPAGFLIVAAILAMMMGRV